MRVTFVFGGHMIKADWYIYTCQHMNMYERCANVHVLRDCNDDIQILDNMTRKSKM